MQSSSPSASPAHDLEPIERIIYGNIHSHALKESIHLGIFDHLSAPRSVPELASMTETDPGAMHALLGLLESLKLVAREGDVYVNTGPASEFLASASPFFQGDSLERHHGMCEKVVTVLPDLLRKPGLPGCMTGKEFSSQASMKAIEQHGMRGFLQDTVNFIEALPGFDRMRSLCDVGGNHGLYARTLLERHRELRAVIADLPGVTAVVEAMYDRAAFAERLSLLPCNLLTDSLPEEAYDLALASYVLQVFGDTLACVMKKIVSSLLPGGWLVTQNMTPSGGGDPVCRSSMHLMTTLAAQVNHFLPEEKIIGLLRSEGLGDITTGRSGPRGTHLLIAARKP